MKLRSINYIISLPSALADGLWKFYRRRPLAHVETEKIYLKFVNLGFEEKRFKMKKFLIVIIAIFAFQMANAQTGGCVDSSQIDSNVFCTLIWDPVCGCNCETYSNKCVAVFYGGVTGYVKGVCPPVTSYFTHVVQGMTVVFTDSSTGTITNWKWIFGDKDTLNGNKNKATHTYAKAGTYLVCLTITDSIGGCTKTYCDSVIIIFTGNEYITTSDDQLELSIFPVPSNNGVNLVIPHSWIIKHTEPLTLKVYNTIGQVVYEVEVTDELIKIPYQLVDKGVMLAHLISGGKVLQTIKFIIH